MKAPFTGRSYSLTPLGSGEDRTQLPSTGIYSSQIRQKLNEQSIPSEPGDYILWLALPAPSLRVIGQLGAFFFPEGVYAYVGSARGAGGLAGRIQHHQSPVLQPHWHIDYLRTVAGLEAVWWTAGAERLEHRWAAALAQLPAARVIAPRFGASDCRCASHLYHFEHAPAPEDFARLAGLLPLVTRC